MSIVPEFQEANAQYASQFTKGHLPMPPGRAVAVLTCMDARLDPARFLGLEEGDAHVIRNAGGRASEDALRSLVISQQLLNTREVLVIHHTDCGMTTFTNDDMIEILRDRFGQDSTGTDFLAFSDLEASVREDVDTIRNSPLIPKDIPVSGFVYDVRAGALRPVE